MPLSAPFAREHLHTRGIVLQGYRRADGLFDVEASIEDTKAYSFTLHDRGEIVPGEPLHRMLARMTYDGDMVIRTFEADTEYAPYLACPAAAPPFATLAGLSIGPGFLRAAAERIGGTKGCTHLRELLGQMATVALQTMAGQRPPGPASQPRSRPRVIGTCLAWAPDGQVVRRDWPEFYTGPDAAAPADAGPTALPAP